MDALSHALTAASCIVEMRVGSIYTRKGADVVGALSHQVDPSPYRNRNEDLFISVRVRVPSYALTPTLKDFTNKMSEDEREIAIAVLQTKRLELDEAIVRNQEAAADLDAQIEALKEVVL